MHVPEEQGQTFELGAVAGQGVGRLRGLEVPGVAGPFAEPVRLFEGTRGSLANAFTFVLMFIPYVSTAFVPETFQSTRAAKDCVSRAFFPGNHTA